MNPTPRLDAIVDDVATALLEIIARHGVTFEEYRAATEAVLLPPDEDDTHATGDGTEPTAEGPVYVAGAPVLERPYVLPRRPDEPGEPLVFSGTVRAADGSALAGATLDVWQTNGAAEYSHFAAGVPDYNLRGRLTTDSGGRFEFETVVPSPYEVPVTPATGRLLSALGRSTFRPGHIHFKITHPDASPLTTQIFFEDDPWIDRDVVGLVKASLVTKLVRHGDGRSTCAYDFVLT